MVHEQGQQQWQCCLLQIMQTTSRLQAALSLRLGVHETKSTDMHNTDWVRLASLAGYCHAVAPIVLAME